MNEEPDFADDLARVAVRITGIDREAGAKLAAEVRRRFGGRKYLIPRPRLTAEQVDELLKKGLKVPQIAREHGVSNMTVYRRIHEWRKSQPQGV